MAAPPSRSGGAAATESRSYMVNEGICQKVVVGGELGQSKGLLLLLGRSRGRHLEVVAKSVPAQYERRICGRS